MLIDAPSRTSTIDDETTPVSASELNPLLTASGRRGIEPRTGLDWSKLVVITANGAIPNQANWQPNQGIYPAETCARHIYVGLEFDFQNVSAELLAHKDTSVFHGIEAHMFYVEFYAGLKGHYHADKAASGQARRAWNEYVHKQPEHHKKLKPYMDAMFHDGSLVIAKVLDQFWHRPTPISTAIKIAGLSPESKVLVVCAAERISTETIMALGHKKAYTPTDITLTHPDRSALSDIVIRTRKLKRHQAIEAKLHTVALERALEDHNDITTMFNADAIFVCQPMTKDRGSELGIINDKLCEAWQLRHLVDPDGKQKLIHLKGDPLMRGQTTGVWAELEDMTGFISFSQINEEHRKQVNFVNRVADRAREAIEHMAQLRGQGDKVVSLLFDANREDLPLDYVVGRRPQGPVPEAQVADRRYG